VTAPSAFSFREADADDARAIAAAAVEAFQDYRSFAPEGWEPPLLEPEVERLRPLLAGDDLWCVLAERDGRLAAHSAFQAARSSIAPSEDGQLAHLRALFVDRAWWGCGLARTLHSMALEEAARREFTAIRLFTPAGQARARRFYEREGWVATGEPFVYPLGLPLVEYRRGLP
jgi:GNAT superfamily N-acetyltransferase